MERWVEIEGNREVERTVQEWVGQRRRMEEDCSVLQLHSCATGCARKMGEKSFVQNDTKISRPVQQASARPCISGWF